MLDFQITDFWEWFAKNSERLRSDNYDRDLLEKLDRIISDWHFSWEIGPGVIESNSLTISPNGNKELLHQAGRIIERAPELDTWEFYSSKQPKENWFIARLIYEKADINALEWTYVLLKYPDGKLEIIIKADNLKSLDTKTRELAIDLVLTNLLGEKRKMEELDFVDTTEEFDNEEQITALKFLPAHLEEIKKR